MKDYLTAEGYNVKSPRESIKKAFEYELIEDGVLWLEVLEKRNLAAYTYDEQILEELQVLIIQKYFPIMEQLKETISKKL